MSAEIKLLIDGRPPQVISIASTYSIGRGPANDLVINDTRASRNHAVIRLQGDHAYYLVDLGSSNGTLLNGRRVAIPMQLKNGDQIQIAGNKMVFNATAPAPVTTDTTVPVAEMQTQIEFRTEEVSILVVDIRNYTGLSSGLAPEDLSRTVGKWFKDITQVIDRTGGYVDKFIGDAVMAVWTKARTAGDNAYVTGPIQAALEAVKLAGTFDKDLRHQYPKFNFHVGCGINCGRALIGNVGADTRPEITAVGDSVNIAFRLESLCKELDHPIVVSEEVRREAGEAFLFVDLGMAKVKGKDEELHVFTVQSK